jgi:PST family polysaccharide transporter
VLSRRIFAVLVSVANTAVLPHLMSPRAYGLAAMSTVLLSLADMFKDFGLTTALMRKGEIHQEEVNFLFWFNFCTTAVLTLVLAISAPFAGMFFHEPVVTFVILVSLIGFAASGLSLQHRGLIARDLRFSQLALIDSVVLFVQFVVTLVTALIRHDVWSIVFGTVISTVVGSVLTIVASGWRPRRPQIIAEAREILRFGANTSVYSFSIFVSNNITSVLFGRLLGTVVLGQFNRANAVLQIPLRNVVVPVAQATMPVLGRLRPYPEAYKDTYLAFVTRLNMVVMPVSVVMLVCARVAVAAVWGPRWDIAGDLIQCMFPIAFTYAYGYGMGDLFVTQNRARELRKLGIFEMVLRIAALAGGVMINAHWAALAYGWSTFIVIIVRVLVAGRSGPVTVRHHLATAIPAMPLNIGAAVGCLAGLWLSRHYGLAVVPAAIVPVTLGCVLAAVAGVATPVTRHELRNLAKLFKPEKNGGAIGAEAQPASAE